MKSKFSNDTWNYVDNPLLDSFSVLCQLRGKWMEYTRRVEEKKAKEGSHHIVNKLEQHHLALLAVMLVRSGGSTRFGWPRSNWKACCKLRSANSWPGVRPSWWPNSLTCAYVLRLLRPVYKTLYNYDYDELVAYEEIFCRGFSDWGGKKWRWGGCVKT